jgi:tRNA threonylcarbamoyladenosine biosynthesis protein TsaE
MAIHISKSPEETVAFGRVFGERARPGLIVGLKGDLGAGKTQFVRGVAAGLGANDRVHSPTFALINEYLSGRLPVFHIDLYRLETAEAIMSAGLEDFLQQKEGVTLIEWFERLEANGMGDIAGVRIAFEARGEDERQIWVEESELTAQ